MTDYTQKSERDKLRKELRGCGVIWPTAVGLLDACDTLESRLYELHDILGLPKGADSSEVWKLKGRLDSLPLLERERDNTLFEL